tara:strand:- start:152 stop:397 length:246 start_codon:yes stop_codon:yes gene_type:complete
MLHTKQGLIFRRFIMRSTLLGAARKHAEGEIELHKANIEVYMHNPAGIGEHSDIVEAVQKELDKLATADDRLEMLNKYFNG